MSRAVIFWSSLDSVLNLDDAALSAWKSSGVDGFVCSAGPLVGMGGSGPQWTARQAEIRDTNLVARAHALDMTLHLGCYFTNSFNTKTPLAVWTNAAGWVKVADYFSQFAAAARALGFDGLAFDEELYTHTGATWVWNYPGNTLTQSQTRTRVKARGAALGAALAAAWPGVKIVDTGAKMPGGWSESVQQRVNGANYASLVHVDLWDGIQSHAGIGDVTFLEPIFYKTTQQPGMSWSAAIDIDQTAFAAMVAARGWTNDFGQRLRRLPFAWIDAGPNLPWERAREPAHVATQLGAFAAVGDVYNFAYAGVDGQFDYSPYVGAIQAASA